MRNLNLLAIVILSGIAISCAPKTITDGHSMGHVWFHDCKANDPVPNYAVDMCILRPKDLLDILRNDYLNGIQGQKDKSLQMLIVTYWGQTDGWVKEQDIPFLITKLDSKEPCCILQSSLLSYIPLGESSTIGKEAAFLINGFREGKFPPNLYAGRFSEDPKEIREWWIQYQAKAP